jgi:hypothetical protein
MYENFKNALFDREKKRWDRMDYQYLRDENKIIYNHEKSLLGRKNNPGYNFNNIAWLITL